MRREARGLVGGLHAWGIALLSVLLAGTMWVVPYLPTNDGPESVFSTHMENHYSDPDTIYRDVFVPALQFASRGFTTLFGPFDDWLGWQRGLQVALSLMVVLVAWGFVALVRQLPRERRALGFLGFPLALSWELYMGLWAFVVSTAVGLFTIALAVRWKEPGWRERLILSMLLLVQASAHVFGAVLTGCVLVSLCIARTNRERRLAELGWTALIGLPAAAVLGACVIASRGLAKIPLAAEVERFAWHDVVAMLPRTVAPGPLGRALVITSVVVLAVFVAGARVAMKETDGADRGLGAAAVLFVLLAVFAPFQIPGWQAFSERFIPLGVTLAVVACPLERLRGRVRGLVPAALFLGSAASLLLTYPFHRRLAALCPDAIAGLLAPIALTGHTLPVSFRGTERPTYDRINAEVPLMAPLVHMGTLYAAAHGGVAAYSFATNSAVNPFELRPGQASRPLPDVEHYMRAMASVPFHRDLAYRQGVDSELASFGVFYDEMALFGALPEDLAVWRERGYVADWQYGSAFVGHFEPCTIDLVAPAARGAAVFDVRVGTLELLSNVRVSPVVASDGLAHFTVAPAPCGVVAVRARWDDAPGCRNANAEGDLVVAITRQSGRVDCE